MSTAAGQASSAVLWLERIRQYAPLAATLLGLLYASGFVIVNAYLGRYGIRELDALRTRYVGAGFLFLACVVLAAIVATQLRSDALRRSGNGRLVVIVAGVGLGPWLIALAETLVIVRIESGTFGTDAIDMNAAVRTLLILVGTNFALVGALLLFEAAQTARSLGMFGRAAKGLTTWWLIVVILGIALAWSEFVYPRIPAFLGGGKPETVRLVTTSSVADACRPCVDQPVQLIDADDKRIVILARDASGRDFAVEVFLISGSDRAVIHQPR